MSIPESYRYPWSLDQLVSTNGMLSALGVKLESLDAAGATFTLKVGPEHMNTEGKLHGGAIATMLDAACGFSVRFDGADHALIPTVTISLLINYMASSPDRQLTARGRVVGGGRRIVFTTGEIVDGAGTVLATANGTFKRLADPNSAERNSSR